MIQILLSFYFLIVSIVVLINPINPKTIINPNPEQIAIFDANNSIPNKYRLIPVVIRIVAELVGLFMLSLAPKGIIIYGIFYL